tara:strand:+ start:229 stop:357 length:129 start_codon:yes stop_codon:yes gene_type:complete
MKNTYTIFFVFIVLFIIILGLFYVDIPSPSKLINEIYEIEVK